MRCSVSDISGQSHRKRSFVAKIQAEGALCDAHINVTVCSFKYVAHCIGACLCERSVYERPMCSSQRNALHLCREREEGKCLRCLQALDVELFPAVDEQHDFRFIGK